MGLIDSHAHLTFPRIFDQVDGILARALGVGVGTIITVATDVADARSAFTLAETHRDRIHVAAGFHPHEAEKITEEDFSAMAELWQSPIVVALGEMGLDYHYDFADRAVQRAVFARQLELAVSLDKPVVIHSREAIDDTLAVLLAHGFEGRPVVFHCFTGTAEEAAHIAAHGWRISFTGVVTFRNSKGLQEIARTYPAEKLMVETDSPYLSPEPVRSKRPNEPAHVVHIARFLADLRCVSFDLLVEQTAANTRNFFRLPGAPPSCPKPTPTRNGG